MSQMKTALEEYGLTLSDLPHQPSYGSFEPIIQQHGDKLVVGYLLDDSIPTNPFEGWDGVGEIITKENKNDLNLFHEAFALDSNCQPCSDFVLDVVTHDEIKKDWFILALNSSEFLDAAKECWASEVNSPPPVFLTPYLRMMANKEWQEAVDCYDDVFDALSHYDFTFDLLKEMSRDLVESSVIGIAGAVPLSINSYDGAASICSDYMEADGAWLPTDDMRQLIKDRASVLAFGFIEKDYKSQKYKVSLNQCFGEIESPDFDVRLAAFTWLKEHIETRKLELPDDESSELYSRGFNQSAMWSAEEAIELYNQWVTGDVYCICYAAYEKKDGEWELVDDDPCGGYFGIEDAVECLKDEFPVMIPEQPAKAA